MSPRADRLVGEGLTHVRARAVQSVPVPTPWDQPSSAGNATESNEVTEKRKKELTMRGDINANSTTAPAPAPVTQEPT